MTQISCQAAAAPCILSITALRPHMNGLYSCMAVLASEHFCAHLEAFDDDDGIYWYSETVTPASTRYWVEQSRFCTTRAI